MIFENKFLCPNSLLYKAPSNWTRIQAERASILFRSYPDIKRAYTLVHGLRKIFNETTEVKIAFTRLARWYKQVKESGFRAFNTVAKYKCISRIF
ncbi:transposase [Zunongwangia sp. F260]|uniref:Transposase n=1 Tax=Autumnicola lenta TaxID=3075593 RepID=A0ABU3CQ49_9FLAO|nr:transposase [Zunongwangia sp. F260]MDT0648467.1 transposase [Zunongwangia sp. F260]